MRKFLAKTVDIIFLLFAVCYMICLFYAGGAIIFGDSRKYILAGVILLCCVVFAFFGNRIMAFVSRTVLAPVKKLTTLQMVLIIGIVTLVTKLFFVLLFQTDANIHPDMQRYLSFANQIANDGKITEYVWYAYRHKRTAIFGLLLSPFAMLFGSSTQALTAGLTIGTVIASILLFDIIRKYTGNPIAFVGVMTYNLMPFGLFQPQLLVHETPLMSFHIMALWLFLKAREKKYSIWMRILFLVLSACAITLGKCVNPAGAVVVISMIIFAFVDIIQEKITVKKILRFVCFLLIFCITLSLAPLPLNMIVDSMVPVDEEYAKISEKTVTYGWTIYLAFNYERYGTWNTEDYDTYYKFQEIEDPEEAKEYQMNLVKERLSEYVENPLKIFGLMCKKFFTLWGDLWLSFYYEQGNSIEHFVFKGANHLIFAALFLLTVACNLVALTSILFAWRKKKYDDPNAFNSPSMHFKMVVLGVCVALLFSEVMPKYTSHLVILVYAVWMLELKDFSANSAALERKLRLPFARKHKTL